MQTADKDLLYLLRILEAIGKILFYSKGYTTADEFLFTDHQKDYNASLLLMLQIGEQAEKVSKATKEKFPIILWQTIKGFRNRVAHGYVNIDKLIVFDIIKHHLPQLAKQSANALKNKLIVEILIKKS